MSDNYIIEIQQPSCGVVLQAGIVIRDGDRFQFFAASHAFDALEGRYFHDPRKAQHAAQRLMSKAAARRPSPQASRHGSL